MLTCQYNVHDVDSLHGLKVGQYVILLVFLVLLGNSFDSQCKCSFRIEIKHIRRHKLLKILCKGQMCMKVNEKCRCCSPLMGGRGHGSLLKS